MTLGLERGNFWLRKANFFTLTIELAKWDGGLDGDLRDRLVAFGSNPPSRYLLAQREAVNSRRERVLRGAFFRYAILGIGASPDTEERVDLL